MWPPRPTCLGSGRFHPCRRRLIGRGCLRAAVAEHFLPDSAQGGVRLRHGNRKAECVEAGDPVLTDAARDYAGVMVEVWRDVQRHAMPAYPAGYSHADGGDLCLRAGGWLGDPDADAAFAPFTTHAEAGKGTYQPFLQAVDEAAHVARRHRAVRAREVQHDVGHALAGAMIGPLPAATGGEGGKAV